MSDQNEPPKGLAEILKEQLAMIALVVLLSGTVYVDSYYSQFGLKLSTLGFESSYIIYRGFTVVLNHASVALPYIVSVVWFAADEIWLRPKGNRRAFRVIAAYVVVVAVLAGSYMLARDAGVSTATADTHQETSFLLKIKTSKPLIEDCDPDACRILFADSNAIYVLKPTPLKQSASIPNIRILDRKEYSAIITGVQ